MPPKRTSKRKTEVDLKENETEVTSTVSEPTKPARGRGRPKKVSRAGKQSEKVNQPPAEVKAPAEKKGRGRPAKSKSPSKDNSQNGDDSLVEENQSKASPKKTKATKRTLLVEISAEPPKKRGKAKEQVAEEDEDGDSLQNAKTIYEFKVNDINGKEVSLQKYKGHVCIIVNVASRCGHTKSNYEQFVQLFDKYSKDKGLRILGFPCNQFGKQEPGDSQKICEFAKKKNVKFDMFEKIEVNGKNAHPLWKFLTNQISGPKGSKIDWNFTKFIIDKKGNVVERHPSSVKPLQMVEMLEKYW